MCLFFSLSGALKTANQILNYLITISKHKLPPCLIRIDFLPSIASKSNTAPLASDISIESSESPREGLRETEMEMFKSQEVRGSGQEVEWLFNEMEVNWCEGFFRAYPPSADVLALHLYNNS